MLLVGDRQRERMTSFAFLSGFILLRGGRSSHLPFVYCDKFFCSDVGLVNPLIVAGE